MEDQKASFVAQEKYDQLESEVVHLRQQLSELQRMIFGAKSERFIPSASNQIPLFEFSNQKEEETEEQEISYNRKKAKKEKEQPVRALLAAHLPRKEEIIEPKKKEEGSKKIGEEITEILEYNPAKLYVRRIIRPKYVTRDEQITIGILPSLPIPKGNAGASLLAHIQVSKWVDHLPYYRQIQIFKRSGVRLNKSTLNGWFNASCNLLEPLYQSLVKAVQAQDYLQADESSIRVQDKDKSGATHTGYHWVYHAPLERLVVFDYQPTRSSRGPTEFLKHFQGTLQTDGYTAYNELVKAKGIPFLACMAHARRYFEKALDNDQLRAQYALRKIQELYTLERTMKEENLDSVQKHDL
jgi:transposase